MSLFNIVLVILTVISVGFIVMGICEKIGVFCSIVDHSLTRGILGMLTIAYINLSKYFILKLFDGFFNKVVIPLLILIEAFYIIFYIKEGLLNKYFHIYKVGEIIVSLSIILLVVAAPYIFPLLFDLIL